jgi:hypothetical protein
VAKLPNTGQEASHFEVYRSNIIRNTQLPWTSDQFGAEALVLQKEKNI